MLLYSINYTERTHQNYSYKMCCVEVVAELSETNAENLFRNFYGTKIFIEKLAILDSSR